MSPQFTVVCDCLSFCESFHCPLCDVIGPFFLLSVAVVCDCLSFCESFLCPLCDVIGPFFLLSVAFSFSQNRSLENSLVESIGPYNVSIPS